MKFLRDLFSENSSASMIRVISLICAVNATIIAIVGLNKPQVDYSGLTMLVSAFLTASISGKVMQKKIEITSKDKEL